MYILPTNNFRSLYSEIVVKCPTMLYAKFNFNKELGNFIKNRAYVDIIAVQ